ncbi:50S ribosomal protein L11 [Streptosporangium sp. NBC_01755]|uniref:50S ribosomal protein L11 n=1 Tax=unclassified Streptosporangium TaxID=2632669 RepID=UPI002DDB70CC|nr:MULTISPECIES: 50S ribosomal protein L11 [unclassified Streptosporangium]WSA25109.1 50S ribosomal protein L11 [Streptosporangium sp. NBC_01810]WSD03550.1 50S ribosomal protein L11 [Streptosporangium sp. NBC_01755]
MSKKKISRIAKLQLQAGEAGPATVGKDLGPLGLNLMEFCRRYNAATQDRRGFVVPVVVTVFEDRSFELAVKMPTTASLIRRTIGLDAGSPRPGHQAVGTITRAQLREVARSKMPDLNTADLDQAEKIVAGTARSMGLTVRV